MGPNGRTTAFDKQGMPVEFERAVGATASSWDDKQLIGRIAFDERGLPLPIPMGNPLGWKPGEDGESKLQQRTREFSERMRVNAEYALRAREQRAQYDAMRAARQIEVTARGPSTPRIPVGRGPNATKEEEAANYMKVLLAAGMPPEHLDGLKSVKVGDAGDNHLTGNRAGGYYSTRDRFVMISQEMKHGSAWGLAHEIGHHVHLSRMTAKACDEWANISNSAKTAGLSQYERNNTGEHFAEAYKAYFGGYEHLYNASLQSAGGPRIDRVTGKSYVPETGKVDRYEVGMTYQRERLKAAEPKAFAFMERLAQKDSGMLMAIGRRYRGAQDSRYLQKAGTKSPRSANPTRKWKRVTKGA